MRTDVKQAMMRLRQVALATRDLDATVDALEQVFGLRVAFRDPQLAKYGLRNAVLPAGRSFIEVVEPMAPDASAGRFLDRLGGDGGYMILLQTPDAVGETARVLAQGVRVVERIETPSYACAHFHPADFGGVLVSFDQQLSEADYLDPAGGWDPAGPDWEAAKSDVVREVASATIAAAEPQRLARLWSDRLAAPLDGALRLPLAAGGEIRFAQGAAPRTTIVEFDLRVGAPGEVLERARRAGVRVDGDAVVIAGTRLRPIE